MTETRRYLILGAGRQGRASAFLLAQDPAHQVRLADVDERAAESAAESLKELDVAGQVETSPVDVADERALGKLLGGADAVLSAVPYRFNEAITRACVAHGVGLCDLGGNTGVVQRQLSFHDEAKRAGAAIVPDCGVAPGLANTLAAACLERLDRVTEIRMYCGGLPQTPRPPLGYKMVFNLEGLFNEYSGRAVVIRDGRLSEVEALTEREELDLPGLGRVEAFATSGGTSTAPWSFLGLVHRFEYKTVRYPGHLARFREVADLGLLSDSAVEGVEPPMRVRDGLARLIRPLVDFPDDPDLLVLRVQATGVKDGAAARLTFDLLDRHDARTGFTAMERCTGFPAAVVARMIGEGSVAPGAIPLEKSVAPGPFLEALARTDLPLREAWD